MDNQTPWIAVEDVCSSHYGVSYATAKNKIALRTFPVPTYKVGNKHVIDREVHEKFFMEKRQEGLAALSPATN